MDQSLQRPGLSAVEADPHCPELTALGAVAVAVDQDIFTFNRQAYQASHTSVVRVLRAIGQDPKLQAQVVAALTEQGRKKEAALEAEGKTLLRDIRDIFKDRGESRMGSTDLLNALLMLDGALWRDGKSPLTSGKLAALLKAYDIKSQATT